MPTVTWKIDFTATDLDITGAFEECGFDRMPVYVGDDCFVVDMDVDDLNISMRDIADITRTLIEQCYMEHMEVDVTLAPGLPANRLDEYDRPFRYV